MDHKRQLRRLLHGCSTNRRRGCQRGLCPNHSHEGKRSDMQEDPEFRGERERYVSDSRRRLMRETDIEDPASTYIEFDEVEVPAENLIGKENEGFQIIMSSKLTLRRSQVEFQH